MFVRIYRILTLGLCVCGPLGAIPSLTNQCGQKRIEINYPENVSTIAFNANCDTAFIGPPSLGTITVDSVMGSTNLLFCNVVKTLPKIVESSIEGMRYWARRIETLSKEYDEVAKNIQDVDKKLAETEPLLKAKEETLKLTLENLQEKNEQSDKADELWKSCVKRAGNDASCVKEQQAFLKLMDEVDVLVTEKYRLRRKIIDLSSDISTMQRKKKDIESRIDSISVDVGRFKGLLQSIEKDAFEGYQRYGQISGGSVGLTFNSDWSRLIRRAKELNRNSRITFVQLPLSRSTLHVSVDAPKTHNATSSSMPILLGASIPGFYASDGNNNTASRTFVLDESIAVNPTPWFSAASGQVNLSLIGACDLIDGNNKLSHARASDVIGASLQVNTVHTYPIMLQRKYEIRFNAKRMLDELERVTENNGFLYSERIHEVIKNNFSQNTFDIYFYNNGDRNGFTDEEKKAIEIDAKREIVDKILQEIGAVAQMSSELPRVPRFDSSRSARLIAGASVCHGYLICYVPGFVIGVVDTIFGDKEAVAKFKRVNDIDIRHRYNSESPTYHATSTTYQKARR